MSEIEDINDIDDDDIVYELTLDFYDDVLKMECPDRLSDQLVDIAWDAFRDEMIGDGQEEIFRHFETYAGEIYLTHIELDGPDVRVIIYDAGIDAWR